MAKYSKEIPKIEEIIKIAKEIAKSFTGGPGTSYGTGLTAMELVVAVCEPLIPDIRGRDAANEQAVRPVFNLEQERKKLRAEGKVI